MIEKKQGKINELIYNRTIYNNGTSRLYPTVIELEVLIKEIQKLNETTKYIKFNPFYKNSKVNKQIEYEDYMFYMECRDNFTKEELQIHWTECMDRIHDIPHEATHYDNMTKENQITARILYPICTPDDIETYHLYLDNYRCYINEILPILFDDARKKLNLRYEDLAFGYFCFEVHSK